MATLNINGQRVKVDDSFLSLSPEQQNATVDEIAQSLAAPQQAPQPQSPELRDGLSELSALTQNPAQIGVGEDVARSGAAGVRQGTEGLIGQFGDAAKMQGDIAGWAVGKFGASPETQAMVSRWGSRLSPFGFAPTSETIHKVTNEGIGESYQPKTVAGEYSRTVGQFAPGAVIGPGSLGRKAAMAVVPAVASESAGQLTKGTAAEPYARAAAALAGGVMAAGRNANAVKTPKPVAQSADELANEASQLYQKADQAGVIIKNTAVNKLAGNVQLAAGRINRDLRPNTAGIVDDVAAIAGKDMSLQEMDELRQVVGQSMKNAQPQDVRTLERIKAVIDHFADNVRPGDIYSGGDLKGLDYLKQARGLWARKVKTEILNEVVEKAKNQATGFENGLVSQMRALANNKAKMRGFTADEQRMILSVVRRGSAHGVLRALGMLAPNSTFGGLMTGGVGVGAGVLPGALMAGAGLAAKAGAGKLTRSKMDALQTAVSTGSVPRPSGPAPLNVDALLRTLLAAKSAEISASSNSPVR